MPRPDDLDETPEDATGDVEPADAPEAWSPGDPDDLLPEDFADDPDDTRARTTFKRVGRGGQLIGAAMIGLAEVLQPKPKQEIPIEIATPGEPPNIDTGGLDAPIGEDGDRIVGPPMDRIKARARASRTVKRRRPA